jgi:hypothetical protein
LGFQPLICLHFAQQNTPCPAIKQTLGIRQILTEVICDFGIMMSPCALSLTSNTRVEGLQHGFENFLLSAACFVT